jgi:hypothetical protein
MHTPAYPHPPPRAPRPCAQGRSRMTKSSYEHLFAKRALKWLMGHYLRNGLSTALYLSPSTDPRVSVKAKISTTHPGGRSTLSRAPGRPGGRLAGRLPLAPPPTPPPTPPPSGEQAPPRAAHRRRDVAALPALRRQGAAGVCGRQGQPARCRRRGGEGGGCRGRLPQRRGAEPGPVVRPRAVLRRLPCALHASRWRPPQTACLSAGRCAPARLTWPRAWACLR